MLEDESDTDEEYASDDDVDESTPQDPLYAIVGTQSFNGSFTLTEAFATAIGSSLTILENGNLQFFYSNEAFSSQTFHLTMSIFLFYQKPNPGAGTTEHLELLWLLPTWNRRWEI